MQLGMIGLGRMGFNMARRLIAGGHQVVGYDRAASQAEALRQAKRHLLHRMRLQYAAADRG